MKTLFTISPIFRCTLLLIGLLTSASLFAQNNYSEPPDFTSTPGATTYTFDQAGDYTFSGTVQTPNDQQDAFKVVIPTGFKITKAVLQASGGATQQQPTGFISFADGYSGHNAASLNSNSGVNVTQTGDLGPNSSGNPYIGLTSVDFSVGTNWSIKITVVSTGEETTCTNPTVPTVSATMTAICAGATTTLSIQSGSLNDATNWKWYSGSCGGTLAGTGSSIQVNPGSTTTYYVRGEGGCVAPGSCAAQTITVSAPPQPPAVSPLSYCQGATATSLTANGTNLRFYNTPTGGSSLAGAPTPSTTVPGTTTYYVTQTNGTGCESTRSALTVRVNPLPGAPGVQPVTYCQSATAGPLTATASTGSTLRWYSPGGTPLGSAPTPSTNVPGTTTFFVSQTNEFGCEGTRAAITVTVNALPAVFISGLASAYCQDATAVPLAGTGNPTGGAFTIDGLTATTFNPAKLPTGQHTVVYSYTNANGCSATASQLVTVKEVPQMPTITTQPGGSYPAGQSSLTLSQNVGPVSLTVSGCSGGMLTANGNAASSFTVSTAMTGTQTYTATCTQNGCTGPAASFQLTVVPPSLGVLHRDADYGNLTNNIIKPYLQLTNAGPQTIPYGEITVRYWFTAEGNAPPTNLAVYYAQLGAVNMNYVALSQPRQGANGYVEYSFPGGGSLGAGSNSGPIENGIQKTDGANFDESDDYSYQANYQDYISNVHITAYRNGVIFYGQEPARVTLQTAVQVYSQARDGSPTSQIQTRVELRNTGNVALPVANLKLRYYFTSDNGQAASVFVDYADMGADNVQARVVRLAAPVSGADSYVELSFAGNPMQVNALSSLGAIDFRLVRSDYGLFDQNNDYSYAANYGNGGLNDRITVLLNNTLIFGTPPSGALARVMASEPVEVLSVRVLGNPVPGPAAQIEIRGAEGKAVSLRLMDLQGRAVHEQRIEQAGEVEPVSVPLGQSRGTLLLKVSTDSQQQAVKIVRP